MTIENLKVGDLFVIEKSKGRKNNQVYKVKTPPYSSAFCDRVVAVYNIKKDTIAVMETSLKIVKVNTSGSTKK